MLGGSVRRRTTAVRTCGPYLRSPTSTSGSDRPRPTSKEMDLTGERVDVRARAGRPAAQRGSGSPIEVGKPCHLARRRRGVLLPEHLLRSEPRDVDRVPATGTCSASCADRGSARRRTASTCEHLGKHGAVDVPAALPPLRSRSGSSPPSRNTSPASTPPRRARRPRSRELEQLSSTVASWRGDRWPTRWRSTRTTLGESSTIGTGDLLKRRRSAARRESALRSRVSDVSWTRLDRGASTSDDGSPDGSSDSELQAGDVCTRRSRSSLDRGGVVATARWLPCDQRRRLLRVPV